MTIVIGYWGIPALVTFISITTAVILVMREDDPLVGAFFAPLFMGTAVIVSLLAWCIYFAVT